MSVAHSTQAAVRIHAGTDSSQSRVHQQGAALRGQPVVRCDRIQRTRAQKQKCQTVALEVKATSAGEQLKNFADEVTGAVRNAGLALACAAAVSMPMNAIADVITPPEVVTDLALLTAGDPTKNPNNLLRNSLPINNKPIRVIQSALESISDDLRVPGVRFSGVSKAVNTSLKVVGSKQSAILADVPAENKPMVEGLLKDLQSGLEDFKVVVDNKDKQEVPIKQQELLRTVGNIETAMVNGFPFEVPAEYANLPQLKGRATLEMKVRLRENPLIDRATMRITVDGLNAPVTAGNFVDLVQRKFYDNLEIQRADGFVVQSGDPDGPAIGFVDPSTDKTRTIPLEIMVEGDKTPVYEATLEEIGRYNEFPALPFNAFGSLAMARTEFEPNSASSQFFFLLKESELTPSGANLLDGSYSVFGYVVDNVDLLSSLKVGDLIESIRVVDGAENLVAPSP